MSFILDALKKSETDRQRQASPETAYVPKGAASARPNRWIWIVVALLAANAVGLVIVLLKPASTSTELTTPPPARTTAATSTETREEAVSLPPPEPARTQPADTAAVVQTPAEPATSTTDAVVAAAAAPNPATERSRAPDTGTAIAAPAAELVEAPAAGGGAEFKTFNEARIAGMQVDDLHLDIHVFSDAPAERFVFINMSKYREGQYLDEGPQVAEIRPDGVLLEHGGTLFILPRE